VELLLSYLVVVVVWYRFKVNISYKQIYAYARTVLDLFLIRFRRAALTCFLQLLNIRRGRDLYNYRAFFYNYSANTRSKVTLQIESLSASLLIRKTYLQTSNI